MQLRKSSMSWWGRRAVLEASASATEGQRVNTFGCKELDHYTPYCHEGVHFHTLWGPRHLRHIFTKLYRPGFPKEAALVFTEGKIRCNHIAIPHYTCPKQRWHLGSPLGPLWPGTQAHLKVDHRSIATNGSWKQFHLVSWDGTDPPGREL